MLGIDGKSSKQYRAAIIADSKAFTKIPLECQVAVERAPTKLPEFSPSRGEGDGLSPL
jgi:hypothetical protein